MRMLRFELETSRGPVVGWVTYTRAAEKSRNGPWSLGSWDKIYSILRHALYNVYKDLYFEPCVYFNEGSLHIRDMSDIIVSYQEWLMV